MDCLVVFYIVRWNKSVPGLTLVFWASRNTTTIPVPHCLWLKDKHLAEKYFLPQTRCYVLESWPNLTWSAVLWSSVPANNLVRMECFSNYKRVIHLSTRIECKLFCSTENHSPWFYENIPKNVHGSFSLISHIKKSWYLREKNILTHLTQM